MAKVTIGDAMLNRFFGVRTELPKWVKHEQLVPVVGESREYQFANRLTLMGPNDEQAMFDSRIVEVLRRQFPLIDWKLTPPSPSHKSDKSRLLVGELASDCILLLTPLEKKEG